MRFKKIKKSVDCPFEVDFDELSNHPFTKLGKYELQSLIMHKGKSLESGHYLTLTKRRREAGEY